MALFNYASKELTLKVVYYGPGLSGKTTNIQYLHSTLNPENKGKLLSLATETDRTLFFDFLPVSMGKINDFSIKFQLYTVPGQIRYNSTRKLVLKGADGIVFVADSQQDMKQYNKESFQSMIENMRSNGLDPDKIPIVLQYNKRDLKSLMTIEELNSDLNMKGHPVFLASAVTGEGVDGTFKGITGALIRDLERKNGSGHEKEPEEEAETAALELTDEILAPDADETAEVENMMSGETYDPDSLQPTLQTDRAGGHFFDDFQNGHTGAEAAGTEKDTGVIDLLMPRLDDIQKALDGMALKTETLASDLKSAVEQTAALQEMAQKNGLLEQEASGDLKNEQLSAGIEKIEKIEKSLEEVKSLVSGLPDAISGAVSRAISPSIDSLKADSRTREKAAFEPLIATLREIKYLQEESLSHLKRMREEAIKQPKKKKGFFSGLLGR